ncbi:hypothetical protein K474DRAFT_447976 [Panus rudis PR-1116 ss-1]|nr:hypothetical protein K474DRAFT_447976 [Panus rudis PR-1116 ss-1]
MADLCTSCPTTLLPDGGIAAILAEVYQLPQLEVSSWAESEELRAIAYIYSLRRSRNALVPSIHRLLPNELLAEIFRHAVHEPTFHGRFNEKDNVMRLTSVCHKWRAISVVTGSLWRVFNLHRPAFAVLTASRSRNSDLILYLNTARYKAPLIRAELEGTMLNPLRDCSPQITRIEMDSRDQSLCPYLDLIQQLSLPRLQHLSLAGLCRFGIPYRARVAHFQPNPCLQTLRLRDVQFDWTSSIYWGLRELALDFPFSSHSSSPSLDQLQDILDHCPHLQHLELGDCYPELEIPSATIIHSSKPRTSALMQLEELVIRGHEPERIAKLLTSMSTPPSTQISVECNNLSRSALDSLGIVLAESVTESLAPFHTIRSLSFSASDRNLCVMAWTQPQPDNTLSMANSASHSLRFQFRRHDVATDETPLSGLAQIASTLRRIHLTSLFYIGPIQGGPGETHTRFKLFTTMLSHLPYLETLRLKNVKNDRHPDGMLEKAIRDLNDFIVECKVNNKKHCLVSKVTLDGFEEISQSAKDLFRDGMSAAGIEYVELVSTDTPYFRLEDSHSRRSLIPRPLPT